MILAGGRGERLKPLTNVIPKALAPVNGIPIIRQQIENLVYLGIKEVIILTGYKASMIEDYVARGEFTNSLKINCISTPVEFSTAQRLLEAEDQIGEEFLLMYCDNLVGDFKQIKKVLDSPSPITFLVEKRDIGNVGLIPKIKYSILRSKDTPFVELGYVHIRYDNFYEILRQSRNLPESFQIISSEHSCSAVVTDSSLISISNMGRFNELRSKRRTILIDRDGIINEKMPHRMYLTRFEDYKLLSRNLEVLSRSYSKNTDFVIITNQPGISTGDLSLDFLDKLHSVMIVQLLLLNISIIGLYVCVHHWDEKCDCRKPRPGMLKSAILDYDLDPNSICYIGDEEKDLIAAEAAGILGIQISNKLSRNNFAKLEDALQVIEGQCGV